MPHAEEAVLEEDKICHKLNLSIREINIMIEVQLPENIISFDGRVFEIFCLYLSDLDYTCYHSAQLENIEIKTDKKGRHKLDVTFIKPHTFGKHIYIPDEMLAQVEDLIAAVNKAKASRFSE